MIRRFFAWFKAFAFSPEAEPPRDLTLDELLQLLDAHRLEMYTDGRRLLFCSPRPTLDDQLVRELQRHRATLMQILPRTQRRAERAA